MSVCLNHTDRPAANKCKACLKPICDECAVQAPDGIYCGNTCIDNTRKFEQRMAELGPIRPPPGPFEFLRAPLLLIVGLAFGVSVLWVASPGTAPVSVRRWIQVSIYHQTPSPTPSPSPKPAKKHHPH